MLSSNGEVKIHNILTDNGIDFQEEYEFPDLISPRGGHLRFDFCVFDRSGNIRFLIEYQGKQHYKPITKFGGARGYQKQRYNDIQKIKYCAKNGYTLVRIPYWDEEKISLEYLVNAVREKEVQ